MKRVDFSYFLIDEHNVCLMFAYLCAADLNAAHNLQTYNCLLKIVLTLDDVSVLEILFLLHEVSLQTRLDILIYANQGSKRNVQ